MSATLQAAADQIRKRAAGEAGAHTRPLSAQRKHILLDTLGYMIFLPVC